MSKFYITTPIYYVNAKPHIGHVYTTIAADVLARHARTNGARVLFATGTDENSQKNVEAAAAAGQDIQIYVDEMAGVWEKTFRQLGLSFDRFVRTTERAHVTAVQALLKRIEDAGDIYLGDYEGYYCVGCEAFVAENELVDGKCPIHKTDPQRIQEKNYFFRLSKYRQQLLEWYAEHPGFLQPESARNKMLHYIEHEMADVSISRQAQAWGIRLPQDEQHAVYVWFDALINYLTVTGYPEAGFEQWWPADVHLIGKDIIKFHGAIWPAMLMSAQLELPKRVFAHGFFTVDGQKISKSLGNAIDPLELVREYPLDAIRYYLLRDIPFGNDGDFSHERLRERYNADLANGLGNLVSRTLNMIEMYVPDLEPADETATGTLALAAPAIDEQLEKLAFDKALEIIWQAIAAADASIEAKKPWSMAFAKAKKAGQPFKSAQREELVSVLIDLYQALCDINAALAPFMPETHEKLTALLAARPVKKPAEPLFARK